jgi:hypothetical protein
MGTDREAGVILQTLDRWLLRRLAAQTLKLRDELLDLRFTLARLEEAGTDDEALALVHRAIGRLEARYLKSIAHLDAREAPR